MSHTINYRLLKHEAYEKLTCEIRINDRLAVLISQDNGYKIHPVSDFSDITISPENLKDAVESAIDKLETAFN